MADSEPLTVKHPPGDVSMPDEERAARYKELWFDDGSIILQPRDPVAIAFRVHRFVLSFHSLVFRDMFTVGNAASGVEMNGVPVVQMQDGAEDLFHFLKALYVPTHVRKGTPMKMSFVVMLLEMATKYMVDFLRDELIGHLRMLFPKALQDYLKTWESPLQELHTDDSYGAAYAVEAGRKYNIPEILPAAYSDICAGYTVEEILYGPGDRDGPFQFSPETIKIIIEGRHKLLGVKRRTTYGYIRELLDGTKGTHCAPALSKALHVVVDDNDANGAFYAFENDVSLFGPSASHKELPMPGVCDACRNEWKKAEKESQAEAWRLLPACFGLDSEEPTSS